MGIFKRRPKDGDLQHKRNPAYWKDHKRNWLIDQFVPDPAPPRSGLSKDEVLARVNSLEYWFHHIPLGHGIVTPGHQGGPQGHTSTTFQVLHMLDIPEDLTGKTVLDVGSWDGFFSFEAERRGASRVLAVDKFYRYEDGKLDENEGKKIAASGFFIAREILGSNVEFEEMDVYDLSPERVGMFDVVLFPGVIYHLRHPLLALERVASVTRDLMVLESYCIEGDYDPPAAQFYETDELLKDVTNWWGPNIQGMAAMTRAAGFRRAEIISRFWDRGVVHGFKE